MSELIFNDGTIKFIDRFTSKGFNEINNVRISLLAEEMLWKYSPYFFNKYNSDNVFIKNVWDSIKKELPKELHKINFPKDLEKTFCKMELIRANLKLAKSEYQKTHKLEIAEQKIKDKELYGYCYKDGKKIELSSTVIEDSRFFISRGNERGTWIYRVEPEDIDLNTTDKNYPCIENHHWKSISYNQDVDYIAKYNIAVGDVKIPKFIWISAKSEEKQEDTIEKFEHARQLANILPKVRRNILADLSSNDVFTKENACISYLIYEFAIRIGNEKGEDSIRDETYGASTLQKRHINVDGDIVHLNFVGKDSVVMNCHKKCDNEFILSINELLKNKSDKDSIFNHANSSTVAEYLKSITGFDFMTPKKFRTAIASIILAKELRNCEWDNLTDKQFKNQINECLLVVSKKLNHQKTIEKEKSVAIDKSIKEKLKMSKISMKKTIENNTDKIEKLKSDKKRLPIKYSGKLLKEKTKEINDKIKSLEEKNDKVKVRYDDLKKSLQFKLESKESNLGTAIANYEDPRIVMSLFNYYGKDKSMIFSKSNLEKFSWAVDVDKEYWNEYPRIKE